MLLIEKAPVQNPAFSCWHFTTPKQCENQEKIKLVLNSENCKEAILKKVIAPTCNK
jgi:hypothetical protein